MVAEKGIQNATVLAILARSEDRQSLSEAFARSGWILVFADDLVQALAVLRSILVGVVICDSRLPGGNMWRDLIIEMLQMKTPTPVIVADRHADDSLWLEALNCGAYDLLAKPFDSKEVLRLVTTACHRHESRSGLVRNPKRAELGSRARKEAARAMGAAL